MKKQTLSLLIGACMGMIPAIAHGQIISTIVNTDTTLGYNGDGIPAAGALLATPATIVCDHRGNLFINDVNNRRIRKVNADGIITTYAGTGASGYSGNGGPATAATFGTVAGLAVDNMDNLYFCDDSNNCVRKIDTNGIITLFAGDTGTAMRGFGADGIPATASAFYYPSYIAFDADGNAYISDDYSSVPDSSRIRKVNTSGIISTYAGAGTSLSDGIAATDAILSAPTSLAMDSHGNLYILCSDRVRMINSAGIITTVAGPGPGSVSPLYTGDGGPATAAKFSYAECLATDAQDNLYISDQFHFRIRKVGGDGFISTVAGNGHYGYSGDGGYAQDAAIGTPIGIAFDKKGNLLIADYDHNCIRSVRYNVSADALTANYGGLFVYPNPSTGIFSISCTALSADPAHVIILNLAGVTIADFTIPTGKPVSVHIGAPAGTYIVNLKTRNEEYTRQLIIQ